LSPENRILAIGCVDKEMLALVCVVKRQRVPPDPSRQPDEESAVSLIMLPDLSEYGSSF